MKSESTYTIEQQKFMLNLARQTIQSKLAGTFTKPDKSPEFLADTGACFVTLHSANGHLRGCIGNIIACESLYNNIIHNALNSAFRDPRFSPLSSEEELETLKIEISVLTPMKKISSIKEIELGRHGILFKLGRYTSVFLPQVAPEQGWSLEETLAHLSLKAGLNHDAWKNIDASFETFEAVIISE